MFKCFRLSTNKPKNNYKNKVNGPVTDFKEHLYVFKILIIFTQDKSKMLRDAINLPDLTLVLFSFLLDKRSYRDPEEAAILFGEKIDRLSIETSDSKLGAKLRENLTMLIDNSTGRAINIGYQYGVDLYILVDVSGSISSEALNVTKEFCKAVVDKVHDFAGRL